MQLTGPVIWERAMSVWNQVDERVIRERAYFIWNREGCPDGRAHDHWVLACAEEREHLNELAYEEEKVLADRPDVNMPALLTQDVHGG
jgi:hypothetical protein